MLNLTPIAFKPACAFVTLHHRHHKKPTGMKFCVAVQIGDDIVGVAIAGRPVSRALQDGRTLEVSRTCTIGSRNANSMLYGAIRRAAWALGYLRLYTYTEEGESGASLRASGFLLDAVLEPRGNWAESSQKLKHIRDEDARSNVRRYRWKCERESATVQCT